MSKKRNENLVQNKLISKKKRKKNEKHNKSPWKIWNKCKNKKNKKNSKLKIKFGFDVLKIAKENSERIAKHIRNRRSYTKLSYTIRYVRYITYNGMNKNFDRLALLYKISYIAEFKINSNLISTQSYQ